MEVLPVPKQCCFPPGEGTLHRSSSSQRRSRHRHRQRHVAGGRSGLPLPWNPEKRDKVTVKEFTGTAIKGAGGKRAPQASKQGVL